LGCEQLKRLPIILEECQINRCLLQEKISNHPDILIQQEIGDSSWFGFSLIIRLGRSMTRTMLLENLMELGCECRPIVAGNFSKNPVVKYFDHVTHGKLSLAEYIDENRLFVGNHHYPIQNAMKALRSL